MKKTEQIFKELAEKDFTLTTNPKELTEEDYWGVLQLAMQETAVLFAEWMQDKEYYQSIDGLWYNDAFDFGNSRTLLELFTIFNNEE